MQAQMNTAPQVKVLPTPLSRQEYYKQDYLTDLAKTVTTDARERITVAEKFQDALCELPEEIVIHMAKGNIASAFAEFKKCFDAAANLCADQHAKYWVTNQDDDGDDSPFDEEMFRD